MRALEWAETPLGRVETWPQSLRSAMSICLGSRFPIAIYWGPSLTLLYNDAWSPILGTKHPWALGRGASEVWPEIWPTIGPMFEQVMTTGESTYSEDALLLMHRHGYTEECYFDFTFTPVRGEGGRLEGVFNAVIETTFRVLSERRTRLLRELGERTAPARSSEEACTKAAAALVSAGADVPFCALYLMETEGRTAKLAGCSGLLPHRSLPPVVSLADRDGLWPLGDVYESGEMVVVHGLEKALVLTDQASTWPEPVHAALVVPLVTAGRIAGFLILGVNPRRAIDEEYREFAGRVALAIAAALGTATAYEAAQNRAEQLADLDRAKTAFFSNVSHEFRTPLTLMLGPQEDALASPDGVLRGEDLHAVHRNTLRLLKLVNSLLDFSRLEAGRVLATYEPVDLAALTRDLASTFRSAIERAGLRFDVDCAPLSEPVYVDREMWEKIVLNLLSNAFKFTLAGTIAVSLRPIAGGVELGVRDTGVGIPEKELPRLFERFHRIEGVKGRTHEGTGIGLALVRDFVAHDGGTVGVTSQVKSGTTFTVSLRFGKAHLPAERVGLLSAFAGGGAASFVEEASRWGPSSPETAAPSQGQGSAGRATVLVADDNADMREYLTRLLQNHWTVTAVSDGVQALARARAAPPDLILTDVMMPNLDGFGLLAALRSDDATKTIPVILLSARAGEEASVSGLDAGADDYLVKPFRARELIARISTHLKLAQSRAEGVRQWRRLLSLLDDVPTPISILRLPDRRYEFANRAHVSLTGGSVVGKTLQDAYPEPEDRSGWVDVDRVAATKQPLVREEVPLRLRREGDEVTRYFTTVMQPWIDQEGTVQGVLNVSLDVTDRVLAIRALDTARQEAEQANRAKDEFLAMLGHELRNPLSPILTAVGLMRLRGGDGRELAIIERQVSHLRRLVDDLLDVSRIARGKIELRMERLELASVVLRGIDLASPLLEQRRQELDVQVAAEGLTVQGDSDRLAQVVSNLLSNASKYSEPGTKIQISAGQSENFVQLTVSDQGIGIPADMLGRIFDTFVQQPQAIDRSKGGLGLGLSIVRSLVKQHGGTVEAHSEGVGGGSEFVVRLPLAPDGTQAMALGQAVVSRGEGEIAVSERRRVLIVDDNVDAAETLSEILMALGHETATAHDGLSALTLARTFRPYVCLLDIGLPVMDGHEVAAELRKMGDLPADLRIIAVTGYGQDADRRRSLEGGFDSHLVKPVDLDVLAKLIAR